MLKRIFPVIALTACVIGANATKAQAGCGTNDECNDPSVTDIDAGGTVGTNDGVFNDISLGGNEATHDGPFGPSTGPGNGGDCIDSLLNKDCNFEYQN